MFDISAFGIALSSVFTVENILLILIGTLFGILCGAMPGLSSVMAMTIMVPFTFSMSGYGGILCLLGIFCGSIYGGSITAILINTPGTSHQPKGGGGAGARHFHDGVHVRRRVQCDGALCNRADSGKICAEFRRAGVFCAGNFRD